MTGKRRAIVALLSCLIIAGVVVVYYAPWQQPAQQSGAKGTRSP